MINQWMEWGTLSYFQTNPFLWVQMKVSSNWGCPNYIIQTWLPKIGVQILTQKPAMKGNPFLSVSSFCSPQSCETHGLSAALEEHGFQIPVTPLESIIDSCGTPNFISINHPQVITIFMNGCRNPTIPSHGSSLWQGCPPWQVARYQQHQAGQPGWCPKIEELGVFFWAYIYRYL